MWPSSWKLLHTPSPMTRLSPPMPSPSEEQRTKTGMDHCRWFVYFVVDKQELVDFGFHSHRWGKLFMRPWLLSINVVGAQWDTMFHDSQAYSKLPALVEAIRVISLHVFMYNSCSNSAFINFFNRSNMTLAPVDQRILYLLNPRALWFPTVIHPSWQLM